MAWVHEAELREDSEIPSAVQSLSSFSYESQPWLERVVKSVRHFFLILPYFPYLGGNDITFYREYKIPIVVSVSTLRKYSSLLVHMRVLQGYPCDLMNAGTGYEA